MLLQTNSYIVPREKRTEHARLLQRFKQLLAKHGCEHFEAYEQVGANWAGSEPTGRFVQIMRFHDRQQWLSVQQAEKNDPQAKQLIAEFCELVNLPYQMQAGLFSAVYFTGVITHHTPRPLAPPKPPQAITPAEMTGAAVAGSQLPAMTEASGELPESDAVAMHSEDASDPQAPTEAQPPNDPVAEDSSLDDLAAAADRNGESDVLEYLVDSEPAAADEPERQRID